VNLEMDRINGVSFREVAAQLEVPVLGWVLVAAGTVFVLGTAWRARHQPIVLTGVAAAAAVLLSRGLYYDGGLAVLGAAAAADLAGAGGLRVYVIGWLLGGAQHLRPYFPIPPMTVVLAGALIWIDRLVRRSSQVKHTTDS
jgi:hypothetical protein